MSVEKAIDKIYEAFDGPSVAYDDPKIHELAQALKGVPPCE